MASHTAVLKVAVVVVAVVAAAWGGAEAALQCGDVVSSLSPCLSYVQNGGTVSQACCNGVKALNRKAATTQDRQAVCNCMKTLGAGASADQLQRAGTIPRTCGVSIPIPITKNADCSKVR